MKPFLMQITGQAENRFYGHVHLLAKYCGLEDSPWINGYLQHGWNATDGFGNYLGSKRSANKYVWSKRCENIIKQNGKENVFAIGAPWLYLTDVFPQPAISNQLGVVAYPVHSAAWSQMGDTSDQYANYLKEKYGNTTVVLLNYDFQNPKIRFQYESKGHNVKSHGIGTPWQKGFNPLFLKNQRDLMITFSKVVSNAMSTAILYANSLGLGSEIGGPIDYAQTNADDVASQTGDSSSNLIEVLQNNKELWKEELGSQCKKTPEELREILGWQKNTNKSISYFFLRSKDLFSGSNKFISLQVFHSSINNR